jgi:hypothetical protein
MATKKDTPRKAGAARNSKSAEDKPADELANLLAAVLNHPDLPEPLEESFGEGLNDLFNELPKGRWRRIEYSPAYISLLLSTHKEGGAR